MSRRRESCRFTYGPCKLGIFFRSLLTGNVIKLKKESKIEGIKGNRIVKATPKALKLCIKDALEPHGRINKISDNYIEFVPTWLQFDWELFRGVNKVIITLDRKGESTELNYLIYYGRVKLWLSILSFFLLLIHIYSSINLANLVLLILGIVLMWGIYGLIAVININRFDRFFEKLVSDTVAYKNDKLL